MAPLFGNQTRINRGTYQNPQLNGGVILFRLLEQTIHGINILYQSRYIDYVASKGNEIRISQNLNIDYTSEHIICGIIGIGQKNTRWFRYSTINQLIYKSDNLIVLDGNENDFTDDSQIGNQIPYNIIELTYNTRKSYTQKGNPKEKIFIYSTNTSKLTDVLTLFINKMTPVADVWTWSPLGPNGDQDKTPITLRENGESLLFNASKEFASQGNLRIDDLLGPKNNDMCQIYDEINNKTHTLKYNGSSWVNVK